MNRKALKEIVREVFQEMLDEDLPTFSRARARREAAAKARAKFDGGKKNGSSTFSVGGTVLHAVGRVAQTSQSAASRASKPARSPAKTVPPIWKSATQQVWKPALRDGEFH
jgi:hypothetical protein